MALTVHRVQVQDDWAFRLISCHLARVADNDEAPVKGLMDRDEHKILRE